MNVARRGRRPDVVLLGVAIATTAVYGVFFLWQFPLLGHVGGSAAQIPAIAPGRRHALLLVVGWLLLAALYRRLVASAALAFVLYLPFGVAGVQHNLADLFGHGSLRANSIVWFWPWYVLWLLPFGALATRGSITALMVAFTMSAFAVELLPDSGRRPPVPAAVGDRPLRTGRSDRGLSGGEEDASAQASSGQLTGTLVVHSVSSWLALV